MLGLALSASLLVGPLHGAELGSSPDSGFGAGLMIGEPTGVSLKYWLAEESAIDGGFGWSLADDHDFQVHVSYLYHLFNVIPLEQNRLPLYFGGGLRYKFRDRRDDLFGFRSVVGVAYLFDDLPVDIFAQVGPILDVTPDAKVRFGGSIGARFWF